MKQWDKAAVYRLLTERGIWHEITEHPCGVQHGGDGGSRPALPRGRREEPLRPGR